MEDLELEHLNVNMAFLHRDLDKRHLHVSSGRLHGDGEEFDLISRLKKSLYGLKQASRMWYQKFDSYIRQLDYH